jgi:hypothetical protein
MHTQGLGEGQEAFPSLVGCMRACVRRRAPAPRLMKTADRPAVVGGYLALWHILHPWHPWHPNHNLHFPHSTPWHPCSEKPHSAEGLGRRAVAGEGGGGEGLPGAEPQGL